MNNCIEFSELVSAYADGELSDGDMRRAEEHIGTCESCSAILELYREISVSVNESAVSAPEALRSGVMEKIMSDGKTSAQAMTKMQGDNKASAQNNARKRRPAQIIMLRYAPVAACLALILIALPWIFDTVRHTSPNPGLFSLNSTTQEPAQIAMQFEITAAEDGSAPFVNNGADAGALSQK